MEGMEKMTAEELERIANKITDFVKSEGIEDIDACAGIGLAFTRLLHRALGGDPDRCMRAVACAGDAMLKSMADIIAGQESLDIRTQ
jgi:hypothetical protein